MRGQPIQFDGLRGQRLIASQWFQHAPDVGSGPGCLLKVGGSLASSLLVDLQRLRAGDAQVGGGPDKQHVGHLGVHVGQGEVQVGGRLHLRAGPVADEVEVALHLGHNQR